MQKKLILHLKLYIISALFLFCFNLSSMESEKALDDTQIQKSKQEYKFPQKSFESSDGKYIIGLFLSPEDSYIKIGENKGEEYSLILKVKHINQSIQNYRLSPCGNYLIYETKHRFGSGMEMMEHIIDLRDPNKDFHMSKTEKHLFIKNLLDQKK